MKHTCSNCKYLDKTVKATSDITYRYGCKGGLLPFYLTCDTQLNTCGCSNFKERVK